MFSTSAPWAASVRPHTGPAMTRVRSSTLMPASGRSPAGSGCGGASPIRSIVNSGRPATARPCGWASHSSNDRVAVTTRPGCGRGVLQLERLPAVDGALHRGAVVVGAEQLQRSGAVMRQVGVQPDPASVAGAIDADGLVAMLVRRLAVDPQVALAAELDPGVAHVDADALPPAGPQMPQFVGGERRRGDGGLRRRADREGGGQRRFRAGQCDGLSPASGWPAARHRSARIFRGAGALIAAIIGDLAAFGTPIH